LLPTKFLYETVEKLKIDNDQLMELLVRHSSTLSDQYSVLIADPENLEHVLHGKLPRFFVSFPSQEIELPPATQKNYTVTAIDGSQIVSDDLDVHVSPFVLINVGLIQTNYPRKEVVRFEAIPQLICEQNAGKNMTRDVSIYRTRCEFTVAQESIMSMEESNVLLMDGGLLQWHLTENLDQLKEETLSLVSSTLQLSKEKKVHMLGYISGTAATDVLGSLRALHCTQDSFVCKDCKDSFCHLADQIQDKTLFTEVLSEGLKSDWRISPLFKSNAPMISTYYQQNIYFFYLYNQFEFARIECTEYSISNLSYVVSVLLDQLEKGFGYPVVLQEAHELAILQNRDKIMIEECLIESLKQNKGIPGCRFKNLAKKVKYI